MLVPQTFFHLSNGHKLRVKINNFGHSKWLVVIHGLGEHLDRHLNMLDICAKDYNLLFLDHRGHGLSTGKRAWINHFSEYASDLTEVLEYMKENFDFSDFYIYAHSMGALITLDYYKNFPKSPRPNGIFLSSPAIAFHGMGWLLQMSSSSIMSWIKDLPMSVDIGGENDQERYSHDPAVLVELLNDPLVNQHTESKLMMELVHKSTEITEQGIEFDCPVKVVVGSADKAVCAESIHEFFNGRKNVQAVKIIPGAYHELYKEIDVYYRPYVETIKKFFNIKEEAKAVKDDLDEVIKEPEL